MEKVTVREFEEGIRTILYNELGAYLGLADVTTYEHERILNHDHGIVVKLSSGQEFRMSIHEKRF